MYKTLQTTGVVLLAMVVCSGCVHRYTPRQATYPIKPAAVPKFTSTQTIALENAQISEDEVVLGRFFIGGTWKANLREWTETAIGYLRTQFEKNGAVIHDGAQKKIKVAITMATMRTAMMGSACDLVLEAETPDGYRQEYRVQNRSMAFLGSERLKRSADGAVMKAVVAMLNDERIISYLKDSTRPETSPDQ